MNTTEKYYNSKELARKIFVSLHKIGNEYYVINDMYLLCKINAINDDEAIKIFNESEWL